MIEQATPRAGSPPLAIPCPICGVEDHTPLFRPRLSPGPVVRCRRCGLVYVSPVERRERLAEAAAAQGEPVTFEPGESQAYRDLYLADAGLKRLLYDELLDRLDSMVPRGRLVDVGSYMGLFMCAATERGWTCRGIEPDAEARAVAISRFGLDVWPGTLSSFNAAEGSVEAVTMLQVLEHLTDPRQALRQARRLLKPGGVLAVEVPNIDCWPVRLLGARHRHFARHHFVFFDERTLGRLLADCGFEVVGSAYPRRRVSVALLEFALQWWHPRVHRVLRPLLHAGWLRRRVVALNLREVLSLVARKGPGDGGGRKGGA